MEIEISKPESYDPGAWRAEIRLTDEEKLKFAKPTVWFSIPKLPQRAIHPDEGFLTVVGDGTSVQFKGVFRDGVWQGHVYTNVVPEAKNQTSINAVKQAFEFEIKKHFALFS